MNERNDIETCKTQYGELETAPRTRRSWNYAPNVDIFETPDSYLIEADLPGADRAGIDLSVDDGILTIHAPIAHRETPPRRVCRQEYGVGDFHRRFNIDRSVDVSKIDASYEHGVLTVRLPKIMGAQARRIEIR